MLLLCPFLESTSFLRINLQINDYITTADESSMTSRSLWPNSTPLYIITVIIMDCKNELSENNVHSQKHAGLTMNQK